MAACCADIQIEADDHKVNDSVELKIQETNVSKTFTLSKQNVLLVRVLEAVGLRRVTNFNLKRVTIRKPFCSLQLRNVSAKTTTTKEYKTKTKKSTLFPIWDETFSFNVHEDDFISSKSVIRFNVKGYDRIRPSDLGMVDVSLGDIANNCLLSKQRSFQRWFQLESRTQSRTTTAGKIFVVFQIVEKTKRDLRKVPPIYDLETKEEDVGIYIGTMNCGNAPPPDNLREWLHPSLGKHKIVVVGCQECDWKNEKNEEKIWQDAILKAINAVRKRDNEYIPLAVRSLTEMRLFCFVDRLSLIKQKVCHVSSFQEATGLAKVYGNKGGTLIAFDWGGTSFCFVNCHLAAHQKREYWMRRNSDYKEICSNIRGVGNINQDIMAQFHHVFWMGDLNYRCDWNQTEDAKDTPSEALFNQYSLMINRGEYKELLKYDQLNISRSKGEAFFGFQEKEIVFPPTFKVYPKLPYDFQKKRTPSWCDRILWKSAPGFEKDVECSGYWNAPKILSSDHKPVYGEFSVSTWPRASGRVHDGIISNTMEAIISFRNCKGSGLRSADIGKASDPFIYFPKQELLQESQKSSWIKFSNDPVWRDEDLPSLNLLRTNVIFIKNALLLVQCRDYDRFSASDKLGSGCLYLKPLVDDIGNWVAFKCNLTFEGVAAGLLEGEFRLDFPVKVI